LFDLASNTFLTILYTADIDVNLFIKYVNKYLTSIIIISCGFVKILLTFKPVNIKTLIVIELA